MVVAGGDYVHFVVEYGGKIEKCRVTETALLNRERISRKDAGYAQLIAIFVIHICPGCEDVSAFGIYPVTDEVAERNLDCPSRKQRRR